MENHKSTMKQIPSDLKKRYNSMLVQKGVPEKYHYYYGKWLRYYLGFCEKYRFNQLNKENRNFSISSGAHNRINALIELQ